MTCRAPRIPAAHASARGQRGAGLLEVLVASAVMAPLILAAAVGLMTGMRASANAETAQRLEVALTAATEDVKALAYLPCGTPGEYRDAHDRWFAGQELPAAGQAAPAAGQAAPAAGQAAPAAGGRREGEPRVIAVHYWDQGTTSYATTCTEDGGAQRITVEVDLDGRTAAADVVTRAPSPGRALGLRR